MNQQERLIVTVDPETGRRTMRDRVTGLTITSDPFCELCGINHSGPPCRGEAWSDPHGERPSTWPRTQERS